MKDVIKLMGEKAMQKKKEGMHNVMSTNYLKSTSQTSFKKDMAS